MGNVHGGHIMKLSDEAGGMTASKHARRPVVTIAVDSMTFHSPIHIGNLVTVTGEVTWTGRSSMETRVVVTAENVLTVPTSALFRANGGWSLFVVNDGVVQTRSVQIGQSDGVSTEGVNGLTEGETVVLYTSVELGEGTRVASRT